MAKPKRNSIPKQITFSPELKVLAEMRADQMGISLPEYVRFLVIQDVKPIIDEIPFVDEETEKSIERGLKDYRKKRYTLLKTPDEIQEHLDKLSE